MGEVGRGRVEIVFLRDGTPQHIVGVVGFGRVVGAAGAQVVNIHREVALFFQSAPPFQRVGVIKSVQQAAFRIVAVGEGLRDGVQRDGGKPSGGVMPPCRLQGGGARIVQTVARGPPHSVTAEGQDACRKASRRFRFLFVILIVRERARSGSVFNLRQLPQMIVAAADGGGKTVVIKGNGGKLPGKGGVGAGGNGSPRVRRSGNAVERIISGIHMGGIGIGLADNQPRSDIVRPGGDVPIRPEAGISSDDIPGITEGGKAHYMAGGVISVYGGLYGRPPFGFLAAPDIINGTGCFTKGIGNAGRQIKGLGISVGGRVARGIRAGNDAAGNVADGGKDVTAHICVRIGDARFRISALPAGGRAVKARNRRRESVHDARKSNAPDAGHGFLLQADRTAAILRPLHGIMAAGIRHDGFACKNRTQSRKQGRLLLKNGST